MSPVVVGKDYQISHERGQGRWWSLETLYLHSLLHDPFILCRTGKRPTVALANEPTLTIHDALLFYAQPADSETERNRIIETLARGGAVVLNHPDNRLLSSVPQLNWASRVGTPIDSLRERWDLGSSRTYHYADGETFDPYSPTGAHVLSWIGDHPDLLVHGSASLFAGNPWASILRYLNAPVFSMLLLDFADLLIRATALLTHQPMTDAELKLVSQHRELRRDFHAFGFAAFTVEQLEESLGVSQVDLSDASEKVIAAARSLAVDELADAQALLQEGFELLEQENRKLQPTPAIFTDTLHGGGLFEGIGYCEFDWPQHAADVLSNHLDWAETRGYRFNIDFAAKSLEQMSRRYPKLFARLRRAIELHQVEIVNGTWNQPYPPFFTLQSMIRQFDLGCESVQTIVGVRPTSFASQEFSFTPQTASILAQHGYSGVVLRSQNMGDVPTLNANYATWIAPNGDHIPALPSHRYKSEQLNEVTYNNLHLKLFAAKDLPTPQVFTGLGDLTYFRPFREELARSAHYANVFGRFTTWRDYFNAGKGTACPELRPAMEDFDCRAAFLEVKQWQHLRATGGGSVEHCTRSAAASELFRARELLSLLEDAADSSGEESVENWRALLTYQGHDRYFSPKWPSGGFMGARFNPTRRKGRIDETVADYCGPADTTTLRQRADTDLLHAERSAKRSIRRTLGAAESFKSNVHQWTIFNPGGATQRTLRFRKAAGQALLINGESIPVQDDRGDLIAAVSLPAYSSICITARERLQPDPEMDHPVTSGDTFLDNGLLRVEFDPAAGTVTRILRPSDGRTLFATGRFVAPGATSQTCEKIHWRARGPLMTSLELMILLHMPQGECRIRARLSLEAGQTWLDLQQRVETCPPISGDQWTNHLGLQFTLTDANFNLLRSHYNVQEPSEERQIFSHNLLQANLSDGVQLGWMNRGNQFYVREQNAISAILLSENESARKFVHRIGYSRGTALSEARAWLSPVFVVPADSTAPLHAKLITLDSDKVELLSAVRVGNQLQVRLANLCGESVLLTLSTRKPARAAWRTDFTGKRTAAIEISDGRINLTLRPWDIAQLEVIE